MHKHEAFMMVRHLLEQNIATTIYSSTYHTQHTTTLLRLTILAQYHHYAR